MSEDELREQIRAQVVAEQDDVLRERLVAERAASIKRAGVTTRALVGTFSTILGWILPPKLDRGESAELVELWTPVVELYQDEWFTSPFFAPGMATLAIILERLARRQRETKRRILASGS